MKNTPTDKEQKHEKLPSRHIAKRLFLLPPSGSKPFDTLLSVPERIFWKSWSWKNQQATTKTWKITQHTKNKSMKHYPVYEEQKHVKLSNIQRTKEWKTTQHTKNKRMKNYPAYKEQKNEKLPSIQRTKAWNISQHTKNKSKKHYPVYKE